MKTWKYTFILLIYLSNSVSFWLNISCLQTVRGGRHVEFNFGWWKNIFGTILFVLQIPGKEKKPSIKTWKHTFMLLLYLYNSMSLWLNISWLQTVRGVRHLGFNIDGGGISLDLFYLYCKSQVRKKTLSFQIRPENMLSFFHALIPFIKKIW